MLYPSGSLLNVFAIDVYLLPLTNILDLLIIPKLLSNFTSWQDIFTHRKSLPTQTSCVINFPSAPSTMSCSNSGLVGLNAIM